jgi:hypothetical protein
LITISLNPGFSFFFGKLKKENELSYDEILQDFDRLLPLYIYVESNVIINTKIKSVKGVQFKPGCSLKKNTTKVTKKEYEFNIDLRHNVLQKKLYDLLVKKYGKNSVGTECLTSDGKKIDVVVKQRNNRVIYYYYEIKTALTARTAIRESLSQLLEYSYWPGTDEANKLFVVSEAPLDEKAKQYLNKLRKKFSIPIYYKQIKI